MPTFEFTSPEGKSYTVNGPDGATKEQAFQILQSQISAPARASIADAIPGSNPNMQPNPRMIEPEPSKDSFMDKLYGVGVEIPKTLARGAIASIAAPIYGVGKEIVTGHLGDGSNYAEQEASKAADAISYHPTTNTARWAMSKIGAMAEPLQAVPAIHDLQALSQGAASSARSIRQMAAPSALAADAADAATVANGTKGSIRELMGAQQKPAMAGGGAALADEAQARIQRAAAMPVPISLTKGQATRNFADIQFERETAKNPTAGAPLRDRYSEQNQKTLQNIDAYFDETGAQNPNLYSSGKVVTNAVIDKAKAAKQEIKAAYQEARDAGQMEEQVSVQPLLDYVEKNRASMRNAPVVATLEDELQRLTGGKTTLSVNDIEELRKTIGKNGKPNASNSNAAFSPGIVSLIDDATQGKGGVLYQQARRMYENYAKEFRNVGVIDRLMKTKPNTSDRVVAYEDVYNKTIGGDSVSLDDVRHVRRTLQTAGEDGQQAWRELQGQGLQDLKRETFGNISRDEKGNVIASPAKMNSWVEKMDADGRLDFIYGKQGATKIRDMRDLLMDTHTSPPGSVNTSHTTSTLLAMLDVGVSGLSGMPLPVATATNMAVKRFKARALDKRVGRALNPEGGE